MRTYYIYKAVNTVTNKIYIGCTCHPKERFWQHLRCRDDEKCDFHDDILKYGRDKIDFEIIDQTDSQEKGYELEKYYIKKYDSYENGYNMTKGGAGNTLWNLRPVVCLKKDGTFVKRYESAAQAQKEDGFCNGDVLISCKKPSRTCQGYIFMFEDEYINNGARTYIKPTSTSCKKIVQCDIKGNLIAKFDSVSEASKVTNIPRPRISANLIGKNKHAYNYIFVYENQYPIKDIDKYTIRVKGKKIAQVDLETNEIIEVFDRISDAGRKLNVNYKAIHKVVDKPDRTAYGYRWISIS